MMILVIRKIAVPNFRHKRQTVKFHNSHVTVRMNKHNSVYNK